MSFIRSSSLNLLRPARFASPACRTLSTTLPRFNAENSNANANANAKKPSEINSQHHYGSGGSVAPVPIAQSHAVTGDVPAGESVGGLTADVVSGAPSEIRYRPVKIYRPTKSTMQSAKGKTKRWILDWDTLQGAGRWENPLIGWASSADYVQGTSMTFASKEDAIGFAERQGWDYYVETPKVAKIPAKNYASNYVHVPGKLRIHHTK